MSDRKTARMLLGAAERDLLTLRSMTEDAPQESFGFHVQQAAEKALKAWLAVLGETYPLTHNIEDLLELLADRGISMDPFRTLIDFTPYAVEFRYHGIEHDSDPINRAAVSTLVETLLENVRDTLARGEGA